MTFGAGAKPASTLVVTGGDRIYKSPTPGRGRITGLSDVDGLLPDAVATRRLDLSLDLEPLLMMLKQQSGGGDSNLC
jgi:hypothetical protein